MMRYELPAPDLFVLPLTKALPTLDADGVLTTDGWAVAEAYARKWKAGERDAQVETAYPELSSVFFDIREDQEMADFYA